MTSTPTCVHSRRSKPDDWSTDGSVLIALTADGQSIIVDRNQNPCVDRILKDTLRAANPLSSTGASGVSDVVPLPRPLASVVDNSRTILQRSAGSVADRATSPDLAGLSHRESEVLEQVCSGRTNQEIAEHLYLSINTVKTYIRAVYRKIGATRRSQAQLWGYLHGYGSVEESPA